MTRAEVIASLRHLRRRLSLGGKLDEHELGLFDQCVRDLELRERGGTYVLESETERETILSDLERLANTLPRDHRRSLIKFLVQVEAAELDAADERHSRH